MFYNFFYIYYEKILLKFVGKFKFENNIYKYYFNINIVNQQK